MLLLARAIATGPAGLVFFFGHTTFSQGKNKTPFYKKQAINKSARVIFSLSIGLL